MPKVNGGSRRPKLPADKTSASLKPLNIEKASHTGVVVNAYNTFAQQLSHTENGDGQVLLLFNRRRIRGDQLIDGAVFDPVVAALIENVGACRTAPQGETAAGRGHRTLPLVPARFSGSSCELLTPAY